MPTHPLFLNQSLAIFHSSIFGVRPDRTLMRLAIGLGLLFLVRTFVLMPVLTSGESMVPLLNDGQIIQINKMAYILKSPERGDVVVVKMGKQYLIKRIVGLPREEVSMVRGAMLIDGVPLPERYVMSEGNWDIKRGSLGDRKYLVIGDNRTASGGSRAFAVLKPKDIVGRMVYPSHRPTRASTNLFSANFARF